jgi:AMIN domain
MIVIGLASAAYAAPSGGSRLISVRPVLQPQELEVFIQVEGTFEHTFFELGAPARLVIDITPVQEVVASGLITVQAFGVERIKTGQPQDGTARIVFEFSGRPSLYLINKTPDGILVSFLSGTSAKSQARPNPPPPQPQPPAPEQPRPEPAGPEKKPSSPSTTLVGLSLANITLADKRFQDVFGHRIESCLSVDFSQVFFTSGRLALAAGAEYESLSLEGQSTVTGQATQVSIAPLNLGLRLILRRGSLWPYLSAGLAVYHYRETSSLRNTMSYTTGFSLGGGIFVGSPSFELLRAKAFVQWTRAVAQENGLQVNLGGWEIGGGLVLGFSLF